MRARVPTGVWGGERNLNSEMCFSYCRGLLAKLRQMLRNGEGFSGKAMCRPGILLAVSAVVAYADPGRSALSTAGAGGQRSSDLLSSRARTVQPMLRSAPITDPSHGIYQSASNADETRYAHGDRTAELSPDVNHG